MTERCKRCGQSDTRTTIYKETGLCLDCQSDWRLEQNDAKAALLEKRKNQNFYKEFL